MFKSLAIIRVSYFDLLHFRHILTLLQFYYKSSLKKMWKVPSYRADSMDSKVRRHNYHGLKVRDTTKL